MIKKVLMKLSYYNSYKGYKNNQNKNYNLKSNIGEIKQKCGYFAIYYNCGYVP